MLKKKAVSTFAIAFGLAASLAAGQGLAEDLRLEGLSDTLTANELGEMRAQGATNIGVQVVPEQYLETTGDVESGAISFGLQTFDGQRMTINAINTGNNVVMQNQLSVEVNMYDTMNVYNGAHGGN